jgi:hypothetical protein
MLSETKKLIDDNLDLLMKVFIIFFLGTIILRCAFDVITQ